MFVGNGQLISQWAGALENATPWADALRTASGDVVMNKRAGSRGGPFWSQELPLMVTWTFRR